jgi:hypothetical protein
MRVQRLARATEEGQGEMMTVMKDMKETETETQI